MNDQLTEIELKKIKWNPQTNPDVISIVKQSDGNFRGFMQKNGKLIQARQSDPGHVMQLLITHDGN